MLMLGYHGMELLEEKVHSCPTVSDLPHINQVPT